MPRGRRNVQPPIPDDILSMSLEELAEASKNQLNEENQAKFDELVKRRDEAQAAVTAHNQRNYDINRRYLELRREQEAKKSE
jgi:hypothetical protein